MKHSVRKQNDPGGSRAKRNITIRAVRKEQPDVEQLAKALLLIAREQQETERSRQLGTDHQK